MKGYIKIDEQTGEKKGEASTLNNIGDILLSAKRI